MSFSPKVWQNDPNHSTPLGASGLNDLESRIDVGFDDAATATAAAQAASQPVDSDLTAIAALTTTSFGRALLALADAAATRTAIGTVIGTDVQAHDSDLDSIAALSTTAFGRAFLTLADAAAARTATGAAPLASPTFTGTPAAPTPSAADNSTKLATTAYVDTAGALKAPLASPALTGHPTGVTESAGDNSTRLASTAYADANRAALAAIWQFRLRTTGRITVAGAAGTTYMLIPGSADQTALNAGAAGAAGLPILTLDATNDNLNISGMTAKLRVFAYAVTIATGPAVTITVGLYPLTVVASVLTPGTVVANSTVAIASPGTNAITPGTPANLNLPADGNYALGYTVSGTPSASCTIQAWVGARNV